VISPVPANDRETLHTFAVSIIGMRLPVASACVCIAVVAFFSILLVACENRLTTSELKLESKWSPRTPVTARKSAEQISDELDISEAIVRFTISRRRQFPLAFFSIDQYDTTDSLRERFSSLGVPIADLPPAGCRDCGSYLHVDFFLWVSPSEAKVVGGVHEEVCGGVCPEVGIYHVVKNSGRWKVLKYKDQYTLAMEEPVT
jgi:hypothetical protein